MAVRNLLFFALWIVVSILSPAARGGSTLPDGSVVETRDGDLYRRWPDRDGEVRLTFTGGRIETWALLADGRLLITLASHPGHRPSHLLTIHPDGTWMTPWPGGEPQTVKDPEGIPVLPSIVKPEMDTGFLVIFDVARSLDPALPSYDRASLAAVRILGWDGGEKRILAEVAPEADGSVYLLVPADRSLGLELVGPDGGTVAAMKTPFWVRPNERRACAGCHTTTLYGPPNVRPQALLKEAVRVFWEKGDE